MAQTKQGAFDETYPHIEAPTKSITPTEGRAYKLVVDDLTLDAFRDPLVGYLASSAWLAKRKLDGENIRVKWDGEQALWNGKTNRFVCSQDFQNYMNSVFLEEIFEEKFGREKTVLIFGERMGPKVQGNELGFTRDELIVFDVRIGNFWLSMENVREIASYFGLRTYADFQEPIVDSLIQLLKRVARGEFATIEGLVATPLVECRRQTGERVIVKVKNRDYNNNN